MRVYLYFLRFVRGSSRMESRRQRSQYKRPSQRETTKRDFAVELAEENILKKKRAKQQVAKNASVVEEDSKVRPNQLEIL